MIFTKEQISSAVVLGTVIAGMLSRLLGGDPLVAMMSYAFLVIATFYVINYLGRNRHG